MKEQFINVNESGDKFYYSDKEMTTLHREDGPAIELADGHKAWYLNGKIHREDGPAAEYAEGDKCWYINGENLTEKEFNKRTDPVVELTLKEVAHKLGVDVNNLRIKI